MLPDEQPNKRRKVASANVSDPEIWFHQEAVQTFLCRRVPGLYCCQRRGWQGCVNRAYEAEQGEGDDCRICTDS